MREAASDRQCSTCKGVMADATERDVGMSYFETSHHFMNTSRHSPVSPTDKKDKSILPEALKIKEPESLMSESAIELLRKILVKLDDAERPSDSGSAQGSQETESTVKMHKKLQK